MDVTPSASRLTNSLRDIGYDFASAVADLVDNSISAGSRQIDIELVYEGESSYILIADDGWGMGDDDLTEALRFGSRRDYLNDELGRYGLGLKTASLSQCRRVTVMSRRTPIQRRISARTLDLDHIMDTDRWELVEVPEDTWAFRALEWLDSSPGTVVCWEKLDRVLPKGRSVGGGRRRIESLSNRLSDHLGMIFHRFLEGSALDCHRLAITVNGQKVRPWNPFAPKEEARIELPRRQFEIVAGDEVGFVSFTPIVLPARNLFSGINEFERMSGPAKWNRQQGIYVYRADRLVQSGGWCGLRAIDEHTKLARAAIDFMPELDELFRINVAKMRVSLPVEVRPLIEPHVTDLCHRAQEMYRRDLREGVNQEPLGTVRDEVTSSIDAQEIGAAILSASLATKTTAQLQSIVDHLRRTNPNVVKRLGW
jgi:hypothetical protein